jgi:hypothetical protein
MTSDYQMQPIRIEMQDEKPGAKGWVSMGTFPRYRVDERLEHFRRSFTAKDSSGMRNCKRKFRTVAA